LAAYPLALSGNLVSICLKHGKPIPTLNGGLDLNSSSSGCARLGSGVAPSLGVAEKEVAVLIVLVRRHRRYFKQVETKDPASAVVL